MNIYFLVDRSNQTVSFAGPLPGTWMSVTGLREDSYDVVSDLTWAGYPGFGFLREQDAIKVPGITQAQLDNMKAAAFEMQWSAVNTERSKLINEQRWRVERYNDQLAMKVTPTEDITPVLQYIQKLRDITTVFSDPFTVTWPAVPPVPVATA